MRIRPGDPGDLERLISIRDAGLSLLAGARPVPERGAPPDPALFLALGRHLLATGAVFVADDPDPVGFAAAVMRDGVWFLSQLWVVPERHGEGIGAALMDEALRWGRGASTFSVVSSSHPAAQTLYLRRSMYPQWSQYQFEGTAESVEMPEGMEPLAEDDASWVDELDRAVVGLARPEDHDFYRREGATALGLRRGGASAGYVYAWREGESAGRVGPVVAADAADVPLLLRAARSLTGGRMRLTIPGTNWLAMGEAVRLRLRLDWTNTFMASSPIGDGARHLSAGGALP